MNDRIGIEEHHHWAWDAIAFAPIIAYMVGLLAIGIKLL